jgi:hypothetical protein
MNRMVDVSGPDRFAANRLRIAVACRAELERRELWAPAATVEHAAAREASRLWPQLFGMGKG